MPLMVDSLLRNRYRIQKIIAQGGMGAIYRALDETLGVEVAVKENLITSEESSRQFHREATILAGVRHPNLPRVTDHFVIPDQGQYLVMDYIPGEDLRQRIDRKGPLPESEAVLIISAACDALTYLHTSQPPIVHRDIKPGNLKITPEGQVYLVDFGLAKISQAGKATTLGAQALTPGYAPPEQYGRGTDARSDLYSLGATLYAAVTGKTPEDSLARATGSQHLTPVRSHNPNISTGLAAVIEKAMSVAPNERYQTAEEFKAALLQVNTAARRTVDETRQVRVSPAPPSRPPQMQTLSAEPQAAPPLLVAQHAQAAAEPRISARPKRVPWIALAAGVLVLIAGGTAAGLLLTGTGEDSAPATASPLPAALSTLSPRTAAPPVEPSPTSPAVPSATSAPAPTEIPAAIPSPSLTAAVTPIGGASGQLAFASDRSGIPQIYIWEGLESEPRQVTDFTGGACQPDWSPDGLRIVFISPCPGNQPEYPNASLFILNADGSGLNPLDTRPGGDFAPAWSPDGKKIAFVSLRDPITHIYLYDLEAGSAALLSPASSRDAHPAWSPDGSRIAFDTTRPGELQVWTVNPDGSSPREFSPAGGSADSMPAWSPDGGRIYYIAGSSRPVLKVKAFGQAGAAESQVGDFQPVWKPSVSPDSRLIAFESLRDDQPAVYIVSAESGEVLAVISHAGADFDPVWRP